MTVDWNEVKQAIIPSPSYEVLYQRLRKSYSYAFIREKINFSLSELILYTRQMLGDDVQHRYDDYSRWLIQTMTELQSTNINNIQVLLARVDDREKLEDFATKSGISGEQIAALLKYLLYWVVPAEKILPQLVQYEALMSGPINVLRELGVRSNLDLLQRGLTTDGRKTLVEQSGLSETVLLELVNRADFSRLPWASKATISNIIGAGYKSLAQLASAEPGKLFEDFFRYGQSIGKNLKLGNEIDNSYRIAKILPPLLQN